jgi:cell division protein FtsA
MFERHHQIIVGLEIGTSKVCAVVGELNDNGVLSIIGLGQAKSRGVRKGEITDLEAAGEDARAALTEAETYAGAEIRSVVLGITGNHVSGLNNRGSHPIVSVDRLITDEDIQDVIRNAKAINIPPDNQVLHAIRQHFTVDGHTGVANPRDMAGSRIDVDMHVIHGKASRIENPIRVVKGLQLDVDAVAFTGLASSLALLSAEQKEMGAIVVDIGGGTTEYAVYCKGIIKHTGVIGVGGDHVSNDLAYGLQIPLNQAETMKIAHGTALMDDSVRGKSVTLPGSAGMPVRVVNLENLRRIMSVRLEEVFELVARDLAKHRLLSQVRAGVVLCGGGSRIPGIAELASHVFGLQVAVGQTTTINGLSQALEQPEFATAIGLVKFGSFQAKTKRRGLFGSLPRKLGDLFGGKFSR